MNSDSLRFWQQDSGVDGVEDGAEGVVAFEADRINGAAEARGASPVMFQPQAPPDDIPGKHLEEYLDTDLCVTS